MYDNFFSNMKSSPYEPKFMSSKIPPKSIKPPLNNSSKKEEGPVLAFERPQSASNTEKKKATSTIRGVPPSMTTKGTVARNSEEFMVTNSNVKRPPMGRYPSPMVVPKDDNLAISSTQYRDKWRGL
jgi:hypothetical protein